MTNTIWNLLTWVQQETERSFIVASFKAASKEKQWWYKAPGDYFPAFFSNRPFKKEGHPHRHASRQQSKERFLRLDIEFEDHELEMPDDCLQDIIQWAAKKEACGVLRTSHGCHVYFLTEKEWDWRAAYPTCMKLQKELKEIRNDLIVCSASYTKNNWSQTGKKQNHELAFFQKTLSSSLSSLYTYYETQIPVTNSIEPIFSKPLSQIPSQPKKAIVGSRKEARAEFSQALNVIRNKGDFHSMPLMYHTHDAILNTIRTSEGYQWVLKAGSGKKTTCDFLGNVTPSRNAQSNFSDGGHLMHSLSELATDRYFQTEEYLSMDDVFERLCSLPQFRWAHLELENKFGEEWPKEAKRIISYIRENYKDKHGWRFEVSPAIISLFIEYSFERRSYKRIDLQEFLMERRGKKRNAYHQTGTSKGHVSRLLKLAENANIITRSGVGKSTTYSLHSAVVDKEHAAQSVLRKSAKHQTEICDRDIRAVSLQKEQRGSDVVCAQPAGSKQEGERSIEEGRKESVIFSESNGNIAERSGPTPPTTLPILHGDIPDMEEEGRSGVAMAQAIRSFIDQLSLSEI